MAYLSDTARTVLEAAAKRDDLSILPFPESVKAKGGAMQKVLTGLRNRGFVRVIETDGPQRIVITSEGMAAIGGGPEDDADNGPATAADTGATTAEAETPAGEAPVAEEPAPAATEPATSAGTEPVAKPTPRAGTKQALMIDLLKRPEGATALQIAEATGWQHHTIRGAISGALKKKLGLTIEATRTREVGPNRTGARRSTTVYRIIDAG